MMVMTHLRDDVRCRKPAANTPAISLTITLFATVLAFSHGMIVEPQLGLEINQAMWGVEVGGGKDEELTRSLRRGLMDNNYDYRSHDSDDDDALPHQRAARRKKIEQESTTVADETKSMEAEYRLSDFFPSSRSTEQRRLPGLSNDGIPGIKVTETKANRFPRDRRDFRRRFMGLERRLAPLPGGATAVTVTPKFVRGVDDSFLLTTLVPEDSYFQVNGLGGGPPDMFGTGGLGEPIDYNDYEGRAAQRKRINELLKKYHDPEEQVNNAKEDFNNANRFIPDAGMRRSMTPPENNNKTFRIIKVPNKVRSGRRSMHHHPRTIVQEEGADGVVLLSLDGGPLPQFRLPPDRRQYMHVRAARSHSDSRCQSDSHSQQHSGNQHASSSNENTLQIPQG